MAEDDRCEQCGSTAFDIDEDGRTYCENGHEQARGHVVAEDDADFSQRGRTVRKKEIKEKLKFSRGTTYPHVGCRTHIRHCC